MVLSITPEYQVHMTDSVNGYRVTQAKSIILAMGCRERTRGAIGIPGMRPSGILTAGAAQRYVNMEGYMVGKRVVILGSGDIGLIMARRMTLEGAKVLACVEIMPYSSGLTRNIVQCLEDYDIPLLLSHTVIDIRGRNRLSQVVVSKVDESRHPVSGTEITFDCDTLLLSVGLIPENELARNANVKMDSRTGGAVVYENMETSIPGIFACGNALHVHDLADYVTQESLRAGKEAAEFCNQDRPKEEKTLAIINGDGVGYTIPQFIRPFRIENSIDVFFRVQKPFGKSRILVMSEDKQIAVFSREHMSPGEMEMIQLSRAVLNSCEDMLTVIVGEALE